ncbi:MAG: HU family DNA-binding protein [Candidatus Riflebacteria bacterium]|jgi:nucleoid DNA-binding protein|nr:HU family DNA-binding protein [Candidatus Riflebacteria bacterium]
MKKLELVREIAKTTNMTQTQASQALDATLTIIKEALKNKDDVRLVGFGSFKVNTRKARTGVNPQTKKPMNIAASNVAKFVPGKELREMVNNKTATNTTTTNKKTTTTKKTNKK